MNEEAELMIRRLRLQRLRHQYSHTYIDTILRDAMEWAYNDCISVLQKAYEEEDIDDIYTHQMIALIEERLK